MLSGLNGQTWSGHYTTEFPFHFPPHSLSFSLPLPLSFFLPPFFSLSLFFWFFVFFPALYSAGRSVSDTTLLSTLFYCYWPLPATWATFQRRRRLLNDIWVTCSTGQQSWNGTSGTSAHITLMPIPSIPSSASPFTARFGNRSECNIFPCRRTFTLPPGQPVRQSTQFILQPSQPFIVHFLYGIVRICPAMRSPGAGCALISSPNINQVLAQVESTRVGPECRIN